MRSIQALLAKALLVLFATMVLSACNSLFGREGYFRDRGDDYLKASEIPPMKVPREMDSGSISELFVIPPIANDYVDSSADFDVPRHESGRSVEKAQVKIQKLHDRRWIVVNSSPAVVWPKAKQFLASEGLPLSSEDPMTGIMETVWLVLKNEPDSKDRYRIIMEPGLQDGSTDIVLLQMTASAKTPGAGDVNWPARSSNPEREKWLLDKLAVYLADEKNHSVSLLAQAIGQKQKVQFVQPYQSESYLLLKIGKDRAVASVGGALNQKPFAIEQSYPGAGYFVVVFDAESGADNAPEDQPGFVRRLFSRNKNNGDATASLPRYRVEVAADGVDQVKVLVRDTQGGLLPDEERDQMLQIIRRQLI